MIIFYCLRHQKVITYHSFYGFWILESHPIVPCIRLAKSIWKKWNHTIYSQGNQFLLLNCWNDCKYVCWWNRHRHRHRCVVPPLTWHPADVLIIRLHFSPSRLRGSVLGSQPLKGSILKSCEVVLWVSLSPKMFNLAPCLGWLLHSLASEGAVLQVFTRELFWYIGRCNFRLGANFAQFACSPHFCCYFNKRNWKTQKMEQEKEQEEEEVKKRIRKKKKTYMILFE